MKKHLKDAKIIINGKEVDTNNLNPQQVKALLLEALGLKDENKEEKEKSSNSSSL